MTKPFINVEERIDKVVGRRTKAPDPLAADYSSKADAIAWREAFGGVRVPRGLHILPTPVPTRINAVMALKGKVVSASVVIPDLSPVC